MTTNSRATAIEKKTVIKAIYIYILGGKETIKKEDKEHIIGKWTKYNTKEIFPKNFETRSSKNSRNFPKKINMKQNKKA